MKWFIYKNIWIYCYPSEIAFWKTLYDKIGVTNEQEK